jgi:outer membrane protein insertion porin family
MMPGCCRHVSRVNFLNARAKSARALALTVLCGLCCGLFDVGPNVSAEERAPFEATEPVVEIRVEGNKAMPAAAVMKFIKTRVGSIPTAVQVRQDTKALYGTRWFFSVTPLYRTTDEGLVLVFRVLERPFIQRVEYRGNTHISARQLRKLTGVRAGTPYSVSVNIEAAKLIEQRYREKGFGFATVGLEKGRGEQDREVVFVIKEGPQATGRGD